MFVCVHMEFRRKYNFLLFFYNNSPLLSTHTKIKVIFLPIPYSRVLLNASFGWPVRVYKCANIFFPNSREIQNNKHFLYQFIKKKHGNIFNEIFCLCKLEKLYLSLNLIAYIHFLLQIRRIEAVLKLLLVI